MAANQTTLDSRLLEAVQNKPLDEVVRLIDEGANINSITRARTPLLESLRTRRIDVVELLLQRGANPNFTDRSNTSPLIEATDGLLRPIYNYLVDLLIQAGADVNHKNNAMQTPLHNAAKYGDNILVDTLIKNGADVNAQNNSGTTPLHHARILPSAKLLVEAGANLEVKNVYGNTPLHMAVYGKHIDICKYLLEKGVEVDVENIRGETPYFIAAALEPIYIKELIKLLYDYGANPLHKNKRGVTAVEEFRPMAKYQPERMKFLEQLEKQRDAQGLATLAAASQFPNYRPGTMAIRPLPNNTIQRIGDFLGLKNTIASPARGASLENRARFRQQLANRDARLTAARQAVAEQHAAKEAKQLSKAAKEGWYGFMGGKRRKTRAKKTKRRKQTKRQR